MPSANNPDDFAARVNLAANYITQGRNTTRTFDGCFEMFDGDLVAVSLYRRAAKNPRLDEALPRYLDASLRDQTLANYAHIPTSRLAEEARRMREAAKARYSAA